MRLSLCGFGCAVFFNAEIPVRDNSYTSPPPFPLPISRFSLLVYWNKPTPILWMRILLQDMILGFLALNILIYASNAMAGRRLQNGALTATGPSLCCQTESTEVEHVRQLEQFYIK